MAHAQRTSIDGAELACTVQVERRPVVLIHGVLVEASLPLRTGSELTEGERLIGYACRNYTGSERCASTQKMLGHGARAHAET